MADKPYSSPEIDSPLLHVHMLVALEILELLLNNLSASYGPVHINNT